MRSITDTPGGPGSGSTVTSTSGNGALDSNRLLAHGPDARTVLHQARRQGVQNPLVHRPSKTEPAQAFWI